MSIQEGSVQASAQGPPPAQTQSPDRAQELERELERTKQQYAASSTEARRLKAENDAYAARFQQFVQPPPDPYRTLNDLGVPVDALDAVIEQRIQQRFQPIVRGAQARNEVLAEYPDYSKYENDVAQFINSDNERQQTYNSMFQASPKGAMEWAFQKFGTERQKSAPAATRPAGRSEAQIPSSRASEARNMDAGEDITTRAWKHYKETRDPSAFIKARLGKVISDDFLNRGGGA